MHYVPYTTWEAENQAIPVGSQYLFSLHLGVAPSLITADLDLVHWCKALGNNPSHKTPGSGAKKTAITVLLGCTRYWLNLARYCCTNVDVLAVLLSNN